MLDEEKYLNEIVNKAYQHGFVTDIDADQIPPGLNEEVIRLISQKKMSRTFCYNGGYKPIATG